MSAPQTFIIIIIVRSISSIDYCLWLCISAEIIKELLTTNLSLRISKPTVKLQEFRSITSQYQSCIQYSYSKTQTSTDE